MFCVIESTSFFCLLCMCSLFSFWKRSLVDRDTNGVKLLRAPAMSILFELDSGSLESFRNVPPKFIFAAVVSPSVYHQVTASLGSVEAKSTDIRQLRAEFLLE